MSRGAGRGVREPGSLAVTEKRFSHRNCSFILPGRVEGRQMYVEGLPQHVRERTHGCWCSSWRMSRNGLRIWRRGAWRKPKSGELRRVRGNALERWKLQELP